MCCCLVPFFVCLFVLADLSCCWFHVAAVQDKGCAALAAVCLREVDNSKAVIEAGGAHAIVKAMVMFPDKMSLQKNACRCVHACLCLCVCACMCVCLCVCVFAFLFCKFLFCLCVMALSPFLSPLMQSERATHTHAHAHAHAHQF